MKTIIDHSAEKIDYSGAATIQLQTQSNSMVVCHVDYQSGYTEYNFKLGYDDDDYQSGDAVQFPVHSSTT